MDGVRVFLPRPSSLPAGLEVFGEGKDVPMAREADFYTAEEAAKALGIPVRRVFGMLSSGELEGHQDEWARWLVSASAVQGARRSPEPSSDPGGLPEEDTGPLNAEDETHVLDAAATTVLSDGGPLSKPPSGAALLSSEETTQEATEAPVGGGPASYKRTESSDAAATEVLPLGDHGETAAPDETSDETVRELAEQLAAAVAKTRELRDRLELAEATEAALRESLERERQSTNKEGARVEQQREAAEQGEGFWRRRLFGG